MTLEDNTLLKLLNRIEKRLDALEEKVNAHPANQTFHIDRVETMNIRELSYRLKNVDVKQLSGTMNIGNTFLTRTSQKSKRGPSQEDITIRINGKYIPYKFSGIKKSSHHPDKNHTFSSAFSIGDIHIGAVEAASAVNFGNNFPTNFTSSSKHNQGFGNILGDGNDIHDILSHQEERDAVDVFNESPHQQHPEWLKWLKEEQKKDAEDDHEPK
ncbi:hypothetical protein [Peribacillus frigoritolerans]|uniref:hypothetical protein n=1 Tax=Peribacillus frigoritolerans TaxID=450367 RepID=UPI00105A1DDC|nr:hypothetical protein [Peribacillus frigoritolerans]TDL82119.1 hypothetical protein E2R53_00600 [Peribacillus frigoritolerans]